MFADEYTSSSIKLRIFVLTGVLLLGISKAKSVNKKAELKVDYVDRLLHLLTDYTEDETQLAKERTGNTRATTVTKLTATTVPKKLQLAGYEDNMDSQWDITAPTGQIIKVEVGQVDIESSPGCTMDSLALVDGTDDNNFIILCGEGQGIFVGCHFITKRNTLTVFFHSDHSVTSDGFYLMYEAISPPASDYLAYCPTEAGGTLPSGLNQHRCDVSLTNNRDSFASPNYPAPLPATPTSCTWTVQVNDWEQIAFKFARIELQCGGSYNYLEMSNMADMKGRPLKICGQRYNLRLVSTGNVVSVELHYGGQLDQEQNLFHAEYQSFPYGGTNPLLAPTTAKTGCTGYTNGFEHGSRIIGGQQAAPGAWPFQARLVKDTILFCGASILSPFWLISTSHCTVPFKDETITWSVIAGDFNDEAHDGTEQTVLVADIINYHDEKMDLNLIRLSVPLSFNDNVNCISANTAVTAEMHSGAVCYATGWGLTQKGGSSSPILKQVQLHLVTDAICKQTYGEFGHSPEYVCAGESGSDVCSGDSGGPLACYVDHKWQLVGTPALTYCGTSPGMYTRIAAFEDWIRTKVGAQNVTFA